MAITLGTFTQLDDGVLTGTFKTLNVSASLAIVPIDKTSDKAPDHRVYAGPRHEVGAGWSQVAKSSGETYINLKIGSPEFGPNWVRCRLVKLEKPAEHGPILDRSGCSDTTPTGFGERHARDAKLYDRGGQRRSRCCWAASHHAMEVRGRAVSDRCYLQCAGAFVAVSWQGQCPVASAWASGSINLWLGRTPRRRRVRSFPPGHGRNPHQCLADWASQHARNQDRRQASKKPRVSPALV